MVIKSFDAAPMGVVHGTTLYQISEQRGGDGELCLTVDYEALKADRDAQQKRADALAVENAELNSGCGFFAYDPDNGFEEFKTKEEAIAAAESYIDYYRGEACDGWPDEVAQVSWGIIMQESTRVNERPRTNDDSCDPAIETVCDYALLPNIETPATSAALAAIEARGVEKFLDSEHCSQEAHGCVCRYLDELREAK